MDKAIRFLKLLFYISLILLVIISLFPGSLMGLLIFGDIGRQPSLVDNPISQVISSQYYELGSIINHFVYFFYISTLGFFLYLKNQNFQKLVYAFFLLSIILEVIQSIIPNRVFEIYDVSANFIGVLFAYLIVKIYKFWSKK